MSGRTALTRRGFLAATALGGLALAGCGHRAGTGGAASGLTDAIAAAEAARPHSGHTVAMRLTAGSTAVDLGGTRAQAYTYNEMVPGPLIRANVGDKLAVTLVNGLPHASSVHWHGLALRNDMDGAAPATPDVGPGAEFTYRFTASHPGTYWAHPHTDLDADQGLYLPVIIDDPRDRGAYDAEWIVILDDWTAGIGSSPQQLFDGLRSMGMGMSGHGMGDMPGMGSGPAVPGVGGVGTSELLGGDAGDISYPTYVINGRVPAAPSTFTAKPGQRLRIRFINAGSDTAFRVALAEHTMTVTHTDGFPVVPTDVDALLLGMGERYDVVVTARDGVFPLVAAAEGKNASARAVLSTAAGTTPGADYLPPELRGRIGTVATFAAAPEVVLPSDRADTTLTARLTGDMMSYGWTINGRPYGQTEPLRVQQGRNVDIVFVNETAMWHPMHLHGHTFEVLTADGRPGPRKDTLIVLPRQTVGVRLVTDNPGTWMLHCHNTYHQAAGMMTTLDYVAG